jgi:endonuclease-3
LPKKTAKSKLSDDTDLKKRAGKVVRTLAKTYADAECALVHRSPYELMVSTILSAQCTDERVNMVTPQLFRHYPDFASLAAAKQKAVEKLIKSTGFFRAKATNLRGMAEAVVDEHDGELPQDLESLVSLPGVGRKTANVVLGTAFGVPSGVVVDTHVKRISRLLGLTESNNPEIIERDLIRLLPKKEWINFSHRMIHHGRRICIARRPNCAECPLLRICPRVGLAALAESD